MEHDTLARALSTIKNAEAVSKEEVRIKPYSNLISELLNLLKQEGYINDFKLIEDGKGGFLQVSLKGAINKIAAIKPRYSVKITEYEKFETRYLPAKDFGRLIISTPKGMMSHIKSKELKLGGILLAYVY